MGTGTVDLAESTVAQARDKRKRGRGLAIVGEGRALVRFFRDSEASVLGKAFVVLAVAYVVCPVDALPDVAPIIGWLDDLGVAGLAMVYLSRVLAPYRTPRG